MCFMVTLKWHCKHRRRLGRERRSGYFRNRAFGALLRKQRFDLPARRGQRDGIGGEQDSALREQFGLHNPEARRIQHPHTRRANSVAFSVETSCPWQRAIAPMSRPAFSQQSRASRAVCTAASDAGTASSCATTRIRAPLSSDGSG